MLTSGFKLVVLLGLEDRMGNPQPGVMLPQLGDQVVGHKPHRPRQSVQHDGDKGLRRQRRLITILAIDVKSVEVRRNRRDSHPERQEHGTRCDGEGEDVGDRAHDHVRQQDLLLQGTRRRGGPQWLIIRTE